MAGNIVPTSAFSVPVPRYGEADHPGPLNPDLLLLGTSNPSGLRQKEHVLADLGPGIWQLSETQLSSATLPTACKTLRSLGRAQHRDIRVHTGAAVPTRTNSTWAGSWSGVLTASDFPSRALNIPWEHGAYQTGRVQLVQHYIGSLVLTTANVYGFVSGYSHPNARERTDLLLANLTRELVLGGRGPRAISGDFNHDAHSLEQVAIWERLGWLEVQDAAAKWWGQPPAMTFRGQTRHDYIYLSPEAASMLREVVVQDDFAEHSSLIAGLKVDWGVAKHQSWPLPATIPWGKIQVAEWKAAAQPRCQDSPDATQWLQRFSKDFESSLDGYVKGVPGGQLPAQCHGRAQRLNPSVQTDVASCPRPCRAGEEPLRHSLLGLEVKQWYRQLRRLQSLLHALRGGKQSPDAMTYRLDLWRAILCSTGFHGGFMAWFPNRLVKHQGMPPFLSPQLPSLAFAERLFDDFRANFRRFEHWHATQRGSILRAQYEENRNLIFRDLVDVSAHSVETIVKHKTYSAIAVDTLSQKVLLDEPPISGGLSFWSVDGLPVEVEHEGPELLTMKSPLSIHEGLEVEQTVVISDTVDLQHEFENFWRLRWNKPQSEQQDWDRLQAFAEAFLPRLSIHLPPISVEVWNQALRRYCDRAARGPDGFGHQELRNMPVAYTLRLLSFLHSIESGEKCWPDQWLLGFVICLLKPSREPDCVNAYRPIVILSIIYRTWASVRARQILKALEPVMSSGALGYMPGREATSMWYQLEASIEVALQSGDCLAGYSTDIIKAFENLPRRPLLRVAEHLGVPANVLKPWASFLEGLKRRFVIRKCVGAPVEAVSGFPEGDPLSPCAMCIAVLVYHRYMELYEPRLSAFSYVDNWAHTAATSAIVAKGICLTQCVSDMMALELDWEKSYVWGLSAQCRRELQALGLPVATHARELGGLLTFENRTHNRLLVARCQGMGPAFNKLRRSPASLSVKLFALPTKFWSHALHGIAACPLADAHLGKLRSQAVRALQLQTAGSNAMLRLSLSGTVSADPGHFQLWSTVREARRMFRKHGHLLSAWRQYMSLYDGRASHGPFGKLIAVLSQIGWFIAKPPQVIDHHGRCHNLLTMPKSLLQQLLTDAWLRHVSTQVLHRTNMQDLHGIESDLMHLDVRGMTPLNLSRLRALQSGAFLFRAEHAVHDRSLDGNCPTCQVPDTREHRVCYCPRYADCRDPEINYGHHWQHTPRCLRCHLLSPASPQLDVLRATLHALPDCTGIFADRQCHGERQRIFTDGSCFQWAFPSLALAAWAVVNANTGSVLASGPVHGMLQTSPRAETLAALCAIKWAVCVQAPVTIWSDALHVVQQLQLLLQGEGLSADCENHDIWSQVLDVVSLVPRGWLTVQHVHSHLDSGRLESPFEDWLKLWNDCADTAATTANRNRDVQSLRAHTEARQFLQDTAQSLRMWRDVYFGIAEDDLRGRGASRPDANEAFPLPEDEVQWYDREDHLGDILPIDWQARTAAACNFLPSDFIADLLHALIKIDGGSTQVCTVSWIELLFIFHLEGSLVFPAICPTSGKWRSARDVPYRSVHVHAAVQLRFVRKVITTAFRIVGFGDHLVSDVDLVGYGVSMPIGGVWMGCPSEMLLEARQNLASFTRTRPVRVMADLARPVG